MSRKPPTPEQEQARVDAWNRKHPVGTPVRRYRHMDCRDPDPVSTKTNSLAWVLGGHTAVVMVEDKSGCVALATCIPEPSLTFQEACAQQQEAIDQQNQNPKTMRTIEDHKLNGLNDQLQITVVDEPGQGGACHRYDLTGFDTATNPSATSPDGYTSPFSRLIILFQNGPIQEHGVNGISQEALLAIVIDRLRSFEAGPYACIENAKAQAHCEHALEYLHERTAKRLARGVEGTSAK